MAISLFAKGEAARDAEFDDIMVESCGDVTYRHRAFSYAEPTSYNGVTNVTRMYGLCVEDFEKSDNSSLLRRVLRTSLELEAIGATRTTLALPCRPLFSKNLVSVEKSSDYCILLVENILRGHVKRGRGEGEVSQHGKAERLTPSWRLHGRWRSPHHPCLPLSPAPALPSKWRPGLFIHNETKRGSAQPGNRNLDAPCIINISVHARISPRTNVLFHEQSRGGGWQK